MTEENPDEETPQALDLTVLELDQLRAQQQASGLTTLVYGAIAASHRSSRSNSISYADKQKNRGLDPHTSF